jgi:hypothetical protein
MLLCTQIDSCASRLAFQTANGAKSPRLPARLRNWDLTKLPPMRSDTIHSRLWCRRSYDAQDRTNNLCGDCFSAQSHDRGNPRLRSSVVGLGRLRRRLPRSWVNAELDHAVLDPRSTDGIDSQTSRPFQCGGTHEAFEACIDQRD